MNPDLAKLDTVCSSSLGVVGSPSVALHTGATAAATIYNYKVAAYITVGGVKKQSQPSAIGSIANGPDDPERHRFARHQLDRRHGRQRLQGVPRHRRRHVQGSRRHRDPADFTDDGTATPGDEPENPAENPKLHDCATTRSSRWSSSST